MPRLTTLASLAVVLSTSAACAGLYRPALDAQIKPGPRELDEVSAGERRALLDRAEVFRPVDTARLNLLTGPQGKGAFAAHAEVACQFAFPDEPLTGATPKFECAVAPEDVVKVKFGDDNGEVYAEVAASRLFWALGFFADRVYPVRIVCLNCPADPYRVSTTEWRLGRPGNVGTRIFDPAIIERKLDGESIEMNDFEGWSWQELESVADNEVGASRAQIDALKLLAAFIQHVDSKPENQALLCADDAVTKDRQGNEGCRRPFLMVKDLGSSFAAASKVTFPKMKLESWRGVGVWKDAESCQAQLTSSIVGTLSHPRISEAGRRFLAARLSLLSDKQLSDLFTAARVERRKDKVEGRDATVADWVAVFKAKRDQVVNHRCPS